MLIKRPPSMIMPNALSNPNACASPPIRPGPRRNALYPMRVIIALALPERVGCRSPAIENASGATTESAMPAAKNPINTVGAALIVVASRIPQAVINPAPIKMDQRPRSATAIPLVNRPVCIAKWNTTTPLAPSATGRLTKSRR